MNFFNTRYYCKRVRFCQRIPRENSKFFTVYSQLERAWLSHSGRKKQGMAGLVKELGQSFDTKAVADGDSIPEALRN